MHNSGLIGRPLSKILSLLETDEWCTTITDTIKPPDARTSGDDSNEDNQEQNRNFLSIERLMKSTRFNYCYKVTTIVDKGDDKSSNNSNSATEESNNSSITSKEDSFTPLNCVMTICAIVSTPTRGRNSSKFRKLEVQESLSPIQKNDATKQNSSCTRNTHCLIQLSPCDESCGSSDDKLNVNEATTTTVHAIENRDNSSSSSHAHTCG